MFELDQRLSNDTVTVGELNLSRVLMMNDCQYPWVILVPRISGITEIHQLSEEQRKLLSEESNQAAQLIAKEFGADKMNIAALGNVVSQLHIHHIARFKDDIAWPAPVWGAHPVKPYSQTELQIISLRMKNLFSQMKGFSAQ